MIKRALVVFIASLTSVSLYISNNAFIRDVKEKLLESEPSVIIIIILLIAFLMVFIRSALNVVKNALIALVSIIGIIILYVVLTSKIPMIGNLFESIPDKLGI